MAKIERLTSRAQFAAVLKTGSRVHSAALVAHVLDRGDDRACRVGVIASRRIGGAVQRHRASRRLREAARVALGDHKGLDLILTATSSTLGADFHELQATIFQILDERASVA